MKNNSASKYLYGTLLTSLCTCASLQSNAQSEPTKEPLFKKGNEYGEVALGLSLFGGSARYEQFLYDNVSIGGSIGYVAGEDDGVDRWAFHLAPIARYYALRRNNYGIYVGVSLGYARTKSTFVYLDEDFVTNTMYRDANVGIKWQLTEQILLIGELAYAPDGSTFRVGASMAL